MARQLLIVRLFSSAVIRVFSDPCFEVAREIQTPCWPYCSHEKTPAGAGARGLLQTGRQGPRRPHESNLAAVELHHQQFVDFEGHPFALDAAIDLGGHLGLIELQVGWHIGQAGKGEVGFG